MVGLEAPIAGSTLRIVGSEGSQSILPQSVDSNRYSNPEGILDGIGERRNPVFSNGSALQVHPSANPTTDSFSTTYMLHCSCFRLQFIYNENINIFKK
jgi:hypothetical protein